MNFSLHPSSFTLLFNRRWWWVTLLVFGLAAVFVRLGIWQLDRLEQRRASNTELEQALAAAPTDLNTAVLPEDTATLANRWVVASGEYDFEHQLILRLQSWQGQAGVHLVTPLLLSRGEEEQGSGGAGIDSCELSIDNCQLAVLVDRGWIPEEEDLAQFEQEGEITVEGYAALSQTLLRQPDSASAPRGPEREIFRVNVNAIAPTLPYELLPFYIIEYPVEARTGTTGTAAIAANNALPYHEPREVDLSEGPHLGYAIQWFLFALILVVGYVAYVVKRSA